MTPAPGNPARELELFEDMSAVMADPLMAPHLLRLLNAAKHQEPELYAAWRRFVAQLNTPPQAH